MGVPTSEVGYTLAMPRREDHGVHKKGMWWHWGGGKESKLAKFLKLIGTVTRTIFRKMRMEIILKIYITLLSPTFLCMYVYRFQNVFLRCPTPRLHCFLSSHWPSFRFKGRYKEGHERKKPTFLCGSENWTLTASQRRRIEATEMKLLRPLAGYTLYDHKTNDYIRRELQITGILDRIDEYRRNWFEHLQRMPQIILLQTTRKENNWKTEETLERAVATLETERIKGSNP
jgi:hypothetical protein